MSASDEVLRHEEQLARAREALDLETIAHLYADDLLMTGVLGEPTCAKEAVVEEIRRGRADRDSLGSAREHFDKSVTTEDLRVATHGDAAVATYRSVVTITGPNMKVQRRFRTTNVWFKRDGRWQIIAAHTAFLLDPRDAAMLSGESR